MYPDNPAAMFSAQSSRPEREEQFHGHPLASWLLYAVTQAPPLRPPPTLPPPTLPPPRLPPPGHGPPPHAAAGLQHPRVMHPQHAPGMPPRMMMPPPPFMQPPLAMPPPQPYAAALTPQQPPQYGGDYGGGEYGGGEYGGGDYGGGSAGPNLYSAPTVYSAPPVAAPPQAAPPPAAEPSKKQKGEAKVAIVRQAAGSRWVDPTLMDWPENDFRIFVGNLGNEVSTALRNETYAVPAGCFTAGSAGRAHTHTHARGSTQGGATESSALPGSIALAVPRVLLQLCLSKHMQPHRSPKPEIGLFCLAACGRGATTRHA
jgi:hypothetical protein